jgi:hypothetical protein
MSQKVRCQVPGPDWSRVTSGPESFDLAIAASGKFDNTQANNSIQERLRIVDAQSPVVLPCVDRKFETDYKHRVVVTDLAKVRCDDLPS